MNAQSKISKPGPSFHMIINKTWVNFHILLSQSTLFQKNLIQNQIKIEITKQKATKRFLFNEDFFRMAQAQLIQQQLEVTVAVEGWAGSKLSGLFS